MLHNEIFALLRRFVQKKKKEIADLTKQADRANTKLRKVQTKLTIALAQLKHTRYERKLWRKRANTAERQIAERNAHIETIRGDRPYAEVCDEESMAGKMFNYDAKHKLYWRKMKQKADALQLPPPLYFDYFGSFNYSTTQPTPDRLPYISAKWQMYVPEWGAEKLMTALAPFNPRCGNYFYAKMRSIELSKREDILLLLEHFNLTTPPVYDYFLAKHQRQPRIDHSQQQDLAEKAKKSLNSRFSVTV